MGTVGFQDQDRGPQLLAVFGTGTGIAAIAVALRLWIRFRMLRKVGADDWVVAASLVLVFGCLSCLATSVHHGLGRHADTLTPTQTQTALKLLWVGFCITPFAEATAKISISIMLIRVTTSIKWRWFFISLIVMFIMITIASLFAILLSCRHVELLWNLSVEGRCNVLERAVMTYTQGVMAAAYDVILAIAPIFLVWNVQIDRYHKILLCGLLALGFLTAATGIIRTIYTPESTDISDATYGVLDFLIWKTVELSLSIIVGCLPTLRPLFNRSKLERCRPYQVQNDAHVHGNENSQCKIRKTTSIDLHTSSVSSGDHIPLEQKAWGIEHRVY